MDIALDEVLHFDAITSNPATGAVSDADSTPTWSIFEEDTDTAILSAQNFTKRTSLTGNYRGAATLSTANGFEVGKWYNVVASATVNSVAGKAVVMRFRVALAESVAGSPKVDAAQFAGQTITCSGGVTVPAATLASTTNITAAAGCAVSSIGTDVITSTALAASAVTEIQSGLSTLTEAQVNTQCDTAIADAALASQTSVDTIDGIVDSILVDTAEIGVAGAGLTAAASAALSSLQTHGDSTWSTATGFSTFNPTSDTVAHVTLVDTTTANTDMRGTDNALLASGYTAPDNAGISTASTNTTTILARIGAFAGSGLNTILGFLRAMAAKAAALTPSDLSGGTTYDNTTDSLQAIKDLGNGGGECTSLSAGALAQLAAVKTITTIGPVITVTKLALVQGDDYLTADLTQLQFTNTTGSWPDLTGATVKLYIYRIVNEVFTTVIANGTVITPTGTGQRVDIELPHAKSILLNTKEWAFGVVAILADDSQTTLRSGDVIVTLHPYGETTP